MVVIEPIVREMMGKFQQIQDVPQFIERSLPLMIHFHVSEGLRETFCPPPSEKEKDSEHLDQIPIERRVKKFQMTTLKEILTYNDQNLGKSQDFHLGMLGKRMQIIGKHLLKENLGIHGFRLGRDYHAKMRTEDRSIELLRPQYLETLRLLKE